MISKEQYDLIVKPIFDDIGKNHFQVLETRDHNIAIIFTKKAGGEYPVLGMWWNNYEWVPWKWLENGLCPSINPKVHRSGLDLDLEMKGKKVD